MRTFARSGMQVHEFGLQAKIGANAGRDVVDGQLADSFERPNRRRDPLKQLIEAAAVL